MLDTNSHVGYPPSVRPHWCALRSVALRRIALHIYDMYACVASTNFNASKRRVRRRNTLQWNIMETTRCNATQRSNRASLKSDRLPATEMEICYT